MFSSPCPRVVKRLHRPSTRACWAYGACPSPPHLERRGGCWFENESVKIHLGVDADFRPARKAHPALVVEGLDHLVERLQAAGVTVRSDEPLAAHVWAYVDDPFGNRIELLEPFG